MKKYIVYSIIACLIGISFSSCDFLDKVPDNRTELNTPIQIKELLSSGYPLCNYATITELSADNFQDNNAPDDKNNRYNLPAFGRQDDEAYAWEPIVSTVQQDSPSSVWEHNYFGIAVANHALRRIYEFEAEGRGAEVSLHKAEALILRAFCHFNLVNIFGQTYKNANNSKNDLGVPYVTEPETTVMVVMARLSVAEVYDLIEKDLLEGIRLLENDSNYDIMKYHFNQNASYAFAARFFLYKKDWDKVIKYATMALGPDPAMKMRNWTVSPPTGTAVVNWMINAQSPNNFLLIPTHSLAWRHYSQGYRYAVNDRVMPDGSNTAKTTIFGPGPSWMNFNFHPCYSGKLYINGKQDYGLYFLNAGESFEYTDKVAGIGYPRIVRTEFTAEETLLCRAEAYVHTDKLDLALQDLSVWSESRSNNAAGLSVNELTQDNINTFYTKNEYLVAPPLSMDKTELGWTERYEGDRLNLLYCALHFRRIETIFTGLRWFDVKRYGIEITHYIGKDKAIKLTWDDPRRALQLPAEVIAAGMEPNERLNVSNPSGDPIKYTGEGAKSN